jgi:predicted RNase H-like nuclease
MRLGDDMTGEDMDRDSWHQRLRAFSEELAAEARSTPAARSVVSRAYADAAHALVRLDAALAGEHGAEAPAPVDVVVPVLGVDGCSAGWVGALLEPAAPRPRVVVAPTIGELVAMVRESTGIRVVGIDIPIGLPDSTIRQADILARKALPGKASSIFSTLTRAAYAAPTRPEADTVNRELVGQGVGAQAFALRDKVVEADEWLRTRPTVTVLEIHPELSFAAMTGSPIRASKKTDDGRAQRLEALAAAGIPRPSVLQGQGYAADDVLDACAVAWSAARHAAGVARSLPDPPEVFSDGLPAAIWT